MDSKVAKKIIKKFLYRIYNNPYSRIVFEREIARRSRLPLTDIKGLAKHINLFSPFTFEINQTNDFYGHATVLKQFLGIPQTSNFKFTIEHGIYTSAEQVCDIDIDTPFSTILTCSSLRLPVLKQYKKNVYPVGPIFNYAPSLLSKKEIVKERRRLGKNLLIFPAHSTPDVNAQFDIELFCKKIQVAAQNFDSVRICLYWQDVLNGLGEQYQKRGFECVTAGHVLDPNFLPRLKSIFETSTATFSNDIGGYSGYSVFLNKPHTIFPIPLKFVGKTREINYVDQLHNDKLFNQLIKEFRKTKNTITASQRSLVNTVWGINDIKTKNELRNIIQQAEKSYCTERNYNNKIRSSVKNIKESVKKFLFFINKNPISRKFYEHTINQRATLPFTSVRKLCADINAFSPYYKSSPANNFYGHATTLKAYAGTKNSYKLKFTIEHGLIFSDQVHDFDSQSNLTCAVTMGPLRKDALQKHKPNTYCIGPYIHYARQLHSEKEYAKEKSRIGSTLLAFPAHSTPNIDANYNFEEFCKSIKKIGKDFQTIKVCLYWKDVLRGFDKYYQKAGFECVTAGHVYDPNFLPRLKNIITTADITVSNNLSTVAGYCLYLEKPHIIIPQKVRFKGRQDQVHLVKTLHNLPSHLQLIESFSQTQYKIPHGQKILANQYWGFDEIKTRNQLNAIIDETEKIYNEQSSFYK